MNKHEPSRVHLAIITYKRLELLDQLLTSLSKSNLQLPWERVIVVDNDPDGSAKSIVASHSALVEYVVEPKPGIVAARNRCLSIWDKSSDAIIFLDDDEWVAPDWFENILSSHSGDPSAIIWGPVESVLQKDAPRWIGRGGFIQRAVYEDGQSLQWAATNNVLIPKSVFEVLENPFFEQAFSESGGSDGEFFWRCRQQGLRIKWSANALVFEDVPKSRANLRWISRRLIRYGNVSARLKLREIGRFKLAFLVSGRCVLGLLTLVKDFLTLKGFQVKGYEHLMKGIGAIQVIFGGHIKEYKR